MNFQQKKGLSYLRHEGKVQAKNITLHMNIYSHLIAYIFNDISGSV